VPSLAELQADFAAALADPTLPAPAGSGRRFDAHRNNRAVSLIEALEASFPVVRRLVGNDFFRAAAKAYIRRHPPRTPVLLLYGETFGAFLEGFEPARGVAYLGDVARLEWARLNAFHAADAEPLSLARLAEVPQERLADLRFTLHPSLQLLASRWPVASLWAVTGGSDFWLSATQSMSGRRSRLWISGARRPATSRAIPMRRSTSTSSGASAR